MGSRFVAPETARLDISQGDWLVVKKRLTAGEQRRVFSRMVREMRPGEKVQLDPQQVGKTKAAEYLVDWSLTDAKGQPVVLRGKTGDEIGTMLDALDPDSFREIVAAIDAHEAAQDAAAEQEKNAQAGASA